MYLQQRLAISARRACRTIGQPRSTQRKVPLPSNDEAAMTAATIRLASMYGATAIGASAHYAHRELARQRQAGAAHLAA